MPKQGKPSFMKRLSEAMGKFSLKVTDAAGTSWAFCGALAVIVVWAASGPFFGFSETWQLLINSCTTIVTFLMVFLIQRSQNKETKALEMKLNELVAAMAGASNHLIDVEDASEEELATLQKHYRQLAKLADKETDITCSHSVEEAGNRHKKKASGVRRQASGSEKKARPRRTKRRLAPRSGGRNASPAKGATH